MGYESAARSGPGKIREENQDSLYLNGALGPEGAGVFTAQDGPAPWGLYAMADGMGGEKDGGFASRTAIGGLGGLGPQAGAQGLCAYLLERNGLLCAHMRETGRRCGTTFAGLLLEGERGTLVNIGDSRAYRLRGGGLTQLTRDHTAVRQMVELGVLTPEAARRHPDRHRLTQHLGIFPEEFAIEPETAVFEVCRGDLFLLCSDGLHDMVDEGCIQEVLLGAENLADAAQALFSAAMEAGGRDNITVLLVRVEG